MVVLMVAVELVMTDDGESRLVDGVVGIFVVVVVVVTTA